MMKVFISWSGKQSRAVAEALHWWFPKVLQGVKPFVSAKDIDKGANWTVELARELEEAEFGVVCLTTDNLTSPWLNYETGAITRSVDSRVCPLLHGVHKNEVAPPLSQLQMTDLSDQHDMLLLMTSMNDVAGKVLASEDLAETVGMWWPRLTERLQKIPIAGPLVAPSAAEPAQPKSSDRELLLEVLDAVRQMSSQMFPPSSLVRSLTPEEEAHRTARRALVKELRAAGLPAKTSMGGTAKWTILFDELPELIPPIAYALLSEAARSHEVPIRLRSISGGQSVDFDKNGWSNEPGLL